MKHLGVIVPVIMFFAASFLVAGDIKGKVKAVGVKNNANAVVYIEKIAGKKFDPPKEAAIMDQKNLVFIPHVLPIVAGTTVKYVNSDDVLHNVFSPDQCAQKFNLGTWPKGQARSYTFQNPGCIPVILCNVHPEMEAYILVLETPYYAVTAKEGNYEIKNVPAGKYTLKIWHEKLRSQTINIDVPEKGEATADFELKK
ncbi:MAG: carboxypeptidase regulatory-like domain-containing protein [Ignavibacteriales bacterium]|nr:carboxypeptidase regulatory-like domain-containing protein [Ignavibacteriales bacterium]